MILLNPKEDRKGEIEEQKECKTCKRQIIK